MTDLAFYWVSPRGFSNEGTVYAVPEQHAATAEATLEREFGDDVNAHYRRVTTKQACIKASQRFARWAHTEEWAQEHSYSSVEQVASGTVRPLGRTTTEDMILASAWLWEERK